MKMFLLVVIFGLNCVGHAADLEAGKRASATCIGCHGETGVSTNSLWPNLAGQKKDYLVKQLNAFRSGERKDVMMAPMAQMLSEADVENVASYFSSLSSSTK